MVLDSSNFQLVRYSVKSDVDNALYNWFNENSENPVEKNLWPPTAYFTELQLKYKNTEYFILQERVATFKGIIFEKVEQDGSNYKVRPYGEISPLKWVGGTIKNEDGSKKEIVEQLKEWIESNNETLESLAKTHLSSRNFFDSFADSDSDDDEDDDENGQKKEKVVNPAFSTEDEGLHDAVEDLLQRVAGMLAVAPQASQTLATLLKYVSKRLANEIKKFREQPQDIAVDDIILAFGKMSPSEMAEYGKAAILEDVQTFKSDACVWKSTIISLTEADADYLLREHFAIASIEAKFAFAAGVEYVISEILENSTGLAIKHNSYIVTEYFVKKTVLSDKELIEFFGELEKDLQVTEPDQKLVETNPKLMGTPENNVQVVTV